MMKYNKRQNSGFMPIGSNVPLINLPHKEKPKKNKFDVDMITRKI